MTETSKESATSETEVSQADRIIAKFGGQWKLASALGHKHNTTVQGWHDRGTIPQRHHALILEVAQSLGIELVPEDFLVVSKVHPRPMMVQ